MKAKIDSILILSLCLYATEGRAMTIGADSTYSGQALAQTSSASSSDSTTTDAGDGNSTNATVSPRRSNRHRRDMGIFYLGVCSGQVLAKQGTYLSDVESGATTASDEDLKAAIKNALQTCKAEAKARKDANSSANPTASPTATPVPTATPANTTTTTASES